MDRYHLRTLIGLFLTLLLLILPAGAAAQTGDHDGSEPLDRQALLQEVTLPPVADAFIASAQPAQNFGDGSLRLGYDLGSEGAQRLLLRFDTAAALTDAVSITDARLLLYVIGASPADDTPMPTRLQRVAAPWDENTVTWDSEPTWGPTYTTQFVGSAVGWYEWEITDLVREWVNGTQPDYGVEIIGDEAVQQRERVFHSTETSTTLYPRLVIAYSDVDDIEPPVITVEDLPDFVDETFTVSWSGTDPGPADIATYDVQVQVDGGEWTDWQTNVTFTEAQFAGEDGRTYGFRARGVDTAGNEEAYGDAEATTTVDTQPPVSTVDPLPSVTGTTSFVVAWSGEDAGSGIATYDVFYRVNDGGWTAWLIDTTQTSAIFDVTADDFPEVDGIYAFEVRAVDNLGHQEALNFAVEASTIVDTMAPFVVPRVWLPILAHQAEPAS